LSAAKQFDVVVVGGTPGGIMAGIGAARRGRSVVILERTEHIGGLPANGLGATDISTRGGTGGLFTAFVGRVRKHYVQKYGEDSQQVKDCSDGYHFEPHVGESVLDGMLAEWKGITVLKMRQFDALPANVEKDGGRVTAVRVTNRQTGAVETYTGKVFVDATYEGDLIAAAGCPWRTRREGKSEYHEPLAGKVYKPWATQPHEVGEGTTGEGDDTIQAYNYRLCLTDDPAIRVAIEKPKNYRREEFASIVEDIALGRYAHRAGVTPTHEKELQGIGRITNMVTLPNRKTDSNNQHLAFVSTDLPEENYAWPTANWAWRDAFAVRLREYTLGLLWFVQNDAELPQAFRRECLKWGLARDEYVDNGNFPRQVYVREGRRIEGEYLFTAHDALPKAGGGEGGRPPVHRDSITASHYALDSHAHHKREAGRVHLDGFLSHPTKPYTVPYRVIVPRGVENVLAPVPVSGTHIGFSTLRMEPCWMALGEAAGEAAHLAIRDGVAVRSVNIDALQDALLEKHAVLMYFEDVKPGDADFAAVQKAGLRGELSGWEGRR
jgi:hypothetical protein